MIINDKKILIYLDITCFLPSVDDEKRYKSISYCTVIAPCGSGKKYKKCCGNI